MSNSLFGRFLSFFGFEQVEDDPVEEPEGRPAHEDPAGRQGRRANVVSLPPREGYRIVVSRPRSFEEVQKIADFLKERHPVLVNLEALDKEHTQGLVNFLSGTIYAINGEMLRVGSNLLLFAPRNVEVLLEAPNEDYYGPETTISSRSEGPEVR